jgi:hypothetical protein
MHPTTPAPTPTTPTIPSPHDVEHYTSPRTHADHLRHVRARLHTRFDTLDGADTVDEAVDEAASHFTHARVETFVPLLVERAAKASLTARHRPAR